MKTPRPVTVYFDDGQRVSRRSGKGLIKDDIYVLVDNNIIPMHRVIRIEMDIENWGDHE